MLHESSSNLTRIGLVLGFIAFFMTTPDLLGEKRLRSLQKILKNVMFWLSVTLFILAILSGVAFFLVGGTIFALMVTPAALFLPGGFQPWMLLPLASLLFSWLALKSMEAVELLAKNSNLRKILLKAGIFVFTLGLAAQLLGTFL